MSAALSHEQLRAYIDAEKGRPAICPEACEGNWHAVGCPNGPQFTLGMGTQPQQGPRTREAELAELRERFERLSAVWNGLFRQQWDAAQAMKSCGARIVVLERIETPDPIPGYNEAGGAR